LAALELRQKGFTALLNERYPGIEVTEVIETQENKIITFQKTMDLLRRYPDLNGIYVTGGPIAEVGKAIKLMKMAGRVKVVCFDLYPEVIELLQEDVIDFTIGQDPVSQGYLPVKILFEYLFNNKKPD